MERNANYVAVGAFMLLLIAMGVGFLLWYSKAADSRNYVTYEINFGGSVSGLDPGSVVRYLGVDVGRVRSLSLDRARPSEVKVIVEIDDTAPISSATRASLNMQGVTGLLFINLKQMQNGDATAALKKGDVYPMIESSNSDFDVLLASLPEVVARASTLIDHVDQIFSEKNVAAVSQTLENMRATTAGLPKTAARISEVVDRLQVTLDEVGAAASEIRGITQDSRPEIKQTLQRLNAAADNLSTATAQVNKFLTNSEAQVGHLTEQGFFELERLLRDTRSAANEFRDLSRSLKQQPSQLLYEKPNAGMEISR